MFCRSTSLRSEGTQYDVVTRMILSLACSKLIIRYFFFYWFSWNIPLRKYLFSVYNNIHIMFLSWKILKKRRLILSKRIEYCHIIGYRAFWLVYPYRILPPSQLQKSAGKFTFQFGAIKTLINNSLSSSSSNICIYSDSKSPVNSIYLKTLKSQKLASQ